MIRNNWYLTFNRRLYLIPHGGQRSTFIQFSISSSERSRTFNRQAKINLKFFWKKLNRIPCRAKCSFQTFKALQSPNFFAQFSLINALANVWKSTRWVAVSFDLFFSHFGARLVNWQMYSPIFWLFKNFWFQADQNRIIGWRPTIIRSTDSDFFKNDHIAPLLWFKMCLVIGCAHWTFWKKS